MSSIRDYIISQNAGAVTSHSGSVPDHQADDLLLWLVVQDSGGGSNFTTPSGWTAVSLGVSSSGDCRIGVFWKIAASGSESNPTTTSTVSDSWISTMYSIQNADTTTPIHAHASESASNNYDQLPALTTTNDDTLIIYFVGGDESRGLTFDPSENPCMSQVSENGDRCTIATGWGWQSVAGAVNRPYFYKRQSDGHVMVTIAINDDGSSDVPAYHDPSSPSSVIIHPIWGELTGTHWGGSNSIGAAGVIGSINGVSTANCSAKINIGNAGVNINHDAIRLQLNSNTTAPGADWGMINYALSGAVNLTGKLGIVHMKTWDDKSITEMQIVAEGAFLFGIADSGGNWRVWMIGARDSIPAPRNMIPAVVDFGDASLAYDNVGTIDLTDVTRLFFGGRLAFDVADIMFNMVQTLETVTLIGGSVISPAKFGVAADHALGNFHLGINQQNRSSQKQTFSYQPVQIGNGGGDLTYFSERAAALEFPATSDLASRRVQFWVAENKVGLTIDLGAGDTVELESSSLSGGSKWPFTFAVGTSTSASYSFDGLQVINATVSLQPLGYAIAGITFSECDAIGLNGADLSGGNSIRNTTDTRAIEVTSQADLDKLANCTFGGNGVAILVNVAGSITLTADNVNFDGNTIDIEYSGSGMLTFINSNGSNASTSNATGGGSVDIQTGVSLAVTALDAVTNNPIEDARVYIEAGLGGPLAAGTEIFNGLTDSNGQIGATLNYTADQPIVGRVRKSSSSPYYVTAPIVGTISNDGFSAAVSMVRDE